MRRSKEVCINEECVTLKRRAPTLFKAVATFSLLNNFLIFNTEALLLSNKSMNPFISLAVVFKDKINE